MSDLRTIASGMTFGESPRWHDGHLWLSDWVAQEIVAIDPDGGREVMVQMPFREFPFSIDWLPDGRLLIASSSDRPLLVQEPDGALATYAASDRGWNELVVDGRGNAYVNGAGFDPMAGAAFAAGIVALVTPDGGVRQVADGIAFPNGMVVNAANDTLIVADSYGHELTAFDIGADGDLTNRRVWADVGDGVPDGICMDAEGAIWYADVPNQRCVRVREGGEVVATIDLDRGAFACMLGGADGSTLFIVAAEWHGFDRMADAGKTGVVLAAPAPSRSAGYPASR